MTQDQIDSLLELKKLLDAGIINDSELEEQKKLILNPHTQNSAVPNVSDTVATTHLIEKIENVDTQSQDSSLKQRDLILIIAMIFIIVIIPIIIFFMAQNHYHPSSNNYDTDEEVLVQPAEEAYDYYYSTDSYDYNSDANSWN